MERTMATADADPGSGSDFGIDVAELMRSAGLTTPPPARRFEPECVVEADGITVYTWRGRDGDCPFVPASKAWPIAGGRWRGVAIGPRLAVLPVVG